MKGIDPLAIGTELRLARAGRENVDMKGRRYLIEGRLIVRYCGPDDTGSGTRVEAVCRGREVYTVEYEEPHGWWCSCPARSRCAHIVACELVTTPRSGGDG